MLKSQMFKGATGLAAVALWIALFGAALLIDSKPYRNRLSAIPPASVAATSGNPNLAQKFDWSAFGVSVLLYTPLNAAILTLIAGFIGGCASNITYGSRQTRASGHESKDKEEREQIRQLFLTESPLASMLRSFMVYLGLIAGVYITTNDPFANPTADQYVRFAGTTSLLAFGVGYDPTKFQDLINLVPRLGSKRS